MHFIEPRSRPGLRFLIILLFLAQTHFAQYRFDAFTTDNGLPQNGVRGIAQTPDGYLWFTTFDGLVRYDGVKFTVFDKNNSPGISSNRFSVLHVEPDGTLFAGTEEGGLTLRRDGVFRTYTTADGLPANKIVQFSNDARGELFIETANGNCYFRDGKFIPAPDTEIHNSGLFFRSPTGSVWLYDKYSIRQTTPDGREITYPVKLDYSDEKFNGIRWFEDNELNVWVGDLSAVYRLRDGAVSRFDGADGVPPHTILRPYAQEADGSIWFASGWFGIAEWVGLVRYYQGRFTTWGETAGLSNPNVGQIFKDGEGTIWAATNGGLDHLQKQIVRSYSVADGLITPEVYPLLQTRNGDVYVGTTRGLNRSHDGKFTTAFIKNNEGQDLSVTSLFEDSRGRLWVGTDNSLYRLENERLRRIDTVRNVTVWAISETRSGNIWVGTEKGLIKLDEDDRMASQFRMQDGLPGDDIKAIHEDRNGALWIGTYGGLAKFENDKFVTFTTADGLASDRVRTIYEDHDGVIWIGTYDGGLSRLRDGKFFNYTIENGLFNNGVFQVLEDDKSNFWISCNKGVYRVSRSELDDLADGRISKINSVAYGKADGMLNTECNGGRQPAGIKTADGKFWFPTQNGVVVVDPNGVSFNSSPPPVQIENVLVQRQAADLKNGIEMNANQNNLEIRYTGISFIKPDQIKFRYRIEGLEETWTDVGTIRDVFFPSLPPGEYTFHVIASNSDGVWNEQGARIKIRVLPPFWRAWWFITLMLVGGVMLAFSLYKMRVSQLKQENKRQEGFSRRLIDLQENERKRIAGELHDSLSQNLVIIKNRAMISLQERDQAEQAFEQLEEIADAASESLSEVREIAYNLRPFQIDRLGLTKAIEALVRKTSTQDLSITADLDEFDGVLPPEMEINLYRIVQESLNNMIKHANASVASVTIKRTERNVEVTVQDNGRGFDVSQKRPGESQDGSGFGLVGITERARILGTVPVIESGAGQGTKIYLRVEI